MAENEMGPDTTEPRDYFTEAEALGAGFHPLHAEQLFTSAELADFHYEPHALTFAAMKHVWEATGQADFVAVRARLENERKLEVAGGADFIAKLMYDCLEPENVARQRCAQHAHMPARDPTRPEPLDAAQPGASDLSHRTLPRQVGCSQQAPPLTCLPARHAALSAGYAATSPPDWLV
ncbi:MAG: DnaB-like helicase N-terminal domain-containing protein [Armatimonadota bacterium]